MVFHVEVAGRKDHVKEIFKEIKELNIQEDYPNTLAACAQWKESIVNGDYADILLGAEDYPPHLDLENYPDVLSIDEIHQATMILEVITPDGVAVENVGVEDYVRPSRSNLNNQLKGLVMNMDTEETSKVLFFIEKVGRKNLGFYRGAGTLWTPIYRISAFDTSSEKLIAWKIVNLESGSELLHNPLKGKDGKTYINEDGWKQFLESFEKQQPI